MTFVWKPLFIWVAEYKFMLQIWNDFYRIIHRIDLLKYTACRDCIKSTWTANERISGVQWIDVLFTRHSKRLIGLILRNCLRLNRKYVLENIYVTKLRNDAEFFDFSKLFNRLGSVLPLILIKLSNIIKED